MRLSEALGLVWGEVDFAAGAIRVRFQADGSGRRVAPKTAQARRDVLLMPALARLLRGHRLASRYSGEDDFVFAAATGTAMEAGNVRRRGFEVARERAGIGRDVTMHTLRHGFASLRIAEGLDAVFVSRQL